MPYSLTKHLGTVLLIEASILAGFIYFVGGFWESFCGSDWSTCVNEGISPGTFLTLSALRPFLLTPLDLMAIINGKVFGPYLGAVLSVGGSLLSCVLVHSLARVIGARYVTPWLRNQLPMTFEFIRSQDWKIILATRLIPFSPFDLLTIFYGLADFRLRHVLVFSFLGTLPEVFIFADLGAVEGSVTAKIVKTICIVSACLITPGIVLEYRSRKKGSGMWQRLKAMWNEIVIEIRLSNIVIREQVHDPKKVPVLLVYGFFSSRRSMTSLGRLLERRGYEVITFNLGGLFDVFSTSCVVETAKLIDRKLRRYFLVHDIDRIHIVSHSKGGLVALWWLLNHQGSRFCNRLITMGTPFEGSWLTWLGLLSPLGPFMKDMWQMRPGSDFLRSLKQQPLPADLQIINLFSLRDFVARGEDGIFKPASGLGQVLPIAMNHVSHDGFLKRRDITDTLAYLLGPPVELEKQKHSAHAGDTV